MYRTAADPGLHAACEWLLRQWKATRWLKQVNEGWRKEKEQREKREEGIKELITKDREKSPPQWYVNSQGQTMVVVPGPVEFLMGSPDAEEGRSPQESQHRRRIGRAFALAAKPVTVSEFWRFLTAKKLQRWFEAGGQAAPLMKKRSPDEDGPIILVDWYRAAEYCNWLSEQEGIAPDQWCYETKLDRQVQVTGLKKNYLGLRGYRLPTEAEMEYACRAGAVTSRYYGQTEELLGQYGWYQRNSKERTRPVASKKPNDLGLFDMHGNVFNWCQESYNNYLLQENGRAVEDKEDSLSLLSAGSRVLRGGSFVNPPSFVRSAARSVSGPANRNDGGGFRPARTFR
jgi:formylglycine-generating enzyme required for sulfatase activity